MRRGARPPRARRAARCAASATRPSSCSSSAARSRRRSRSRTAHRRRRRAERRARSVRARLERSTARWRFSPEPSPNDCCSRAEPRRSRERLTRRPRRLRRRQPIAGRLAWEAYLESAVKAVVSLAVSAPRAREVIVSGRFARIASVRDELTRRLSAVAAPPVQLLAGFAAVALQAAQGAALLADGLAGGTVDGPRGRARHTRRVGHGARSSARHHAGSGAGEARTCLTYAPPHVLVAGVSTRAAAESAAPRRFSRHGHRRLRRSRSASVGGRTHARTKVLGARRRQGRAGHRVRRGRVPVELREPPESRRDARPGPGALGQSAGRAPARPRSARPRAGAR